MKIYLVCSTNKSWMTGGYGQSLLAGDWPHLLVSFVEFVNDPRQRFDGHATGGPYIPNVVLEPDNANLLSRL